MVGVVSIREALSAAEEAGLDLLEISPNAEPPVCKVTDYGKYRYEQQKKAAAARKNQKVVQLKEVKVRPNIEENDLQVKLRRARSFLDDGNKVKFSMRFRGRESDHKQIGFDILKRVKEEMIVHGAKVDQEPKFEGGQVIMMISPAPTAK